MIPKIIHYVWFGDNDFGPKEKYCVEGWDKVLPDYKIMRWDNSTAQKFMNNPYFKQAFEAKQYAFASDYARLVVLYEYGGIYLDTDEEVLKSLDCFLSHDFFMGCQSCGIAKGLNPALIGTVPHNPIVKDLLDIYDTVSFINEDGTYNKTPNPAYFARVLTKKYGLPTTYLEKGHIEFYKNSFLYDYWAFGKRNKTSYATHHYAGNWRPDWNISDKCSFKLFGTQYVIRKYKKHREGAAFTLNDGEKLCVKIRTSKRSTFVLLKKVS